MSRRTALEVSGALLSNLFVWVSHTEQIWFPMVGAYVRWIAPAYNLPDLRGPLAFLTLGYIGFRLADFWGKREELKETL